MKKFILLAVLFIGLYLSARTILVWDNPNSDSDVRVSINIPKGSSLKRISEILYEGEIVSDTFAFQAYIKWNKLDKKLQAGEYIIQRNLKFSEIATMLQNGRTSEIKITIPEGSTIMQIDDILTRKTVIEKGTFSHCASHCDFDISVPNLEGYLFPATYYISPSSFDDKQFIQRLYNTFKKKIVPHQKDIQQSGRTLNEIIIVASMIEREAFADAEMPTIADVIWKRLDSGMYLGIDATTRYALNNWKRPLYTEDFNNESPYNTRKRKGLPPTAISNPGMEAIKAAIYPADSPYWYYLHDRTGQIHFAKNLDEHNRYKQQYLK